MSFNVFGFPQMREGHYCFKPSISLGFRLFTSSTKVKPLKIASPLNDAKLGIQFRYLVRYIKDLFCAAEQKEAAAHIGYTSRMKHVVEILKSNGFIRSYITTGKVRLSNGELSDSLDCNLIVQDKTTEEFVIPLRRCIQVTKAEPYTWRYADSTSFPSHFFILLTLEGEVLDGSQARSRSGNVKGVILLEEIPLKSKEVNLNKGLRGGSKSGSRTPKVIEKTKVPKRK